MLPDRVSNPGPLTYESGALPIALRGPAGSRSTLDISLRDGCVTSQVDFIIVYWPKEVSPACIFPIDQVQKTFAFVLS